MIDRKFAVALGLASSVVLCGCDNDVSTELQDGVFVSAFNDLAAGETLTVEEARAIAANAANSVDVPNMAIAVVDRLGNPLLLWNKNPASQAADRDNALALSIARTAAYLSHSQAPLTTRTTEFLNTFHFPSTVAPTQAQFNLPGYTVQPAPQRVVTGVGNTPLAPLYEIQFSNRGVDYTTDGTAYNAGKALPRFLNPDGTAPSPGFTPIPGGLPIYKSASGNVRTASDDSRSGGPDPAGGVAVGVRHVGGIGVYVPDQAGAPDGSEPNLAAQEFAALNGVVTPRSAAGDTFFSPFLETVPPEGGVFLVGILLPAIDQTEIPAGLSPDPNAFAGGVELFASATPGQPDPDGFLIGPIDDPNGGGGLSAAEVRAIVDNVEIAALRTQAAIRLPSNTPCQMVIAITNVDGRILGAYRMTDATFFSFEISITKARNAAFFSNPASRDDSGPNAGLHPLFPAFADNPDALAALTTSGIAVTARSLGFLAAPAYPPVIDGNPPGPLLPLRNRNREGDAFDAVGFARPNASQSGIIFFPGSAPLYRDGVLIGGIGVSGDGVDQDDFVTNLGIQLAEQELNFNLEPPAAIRCDNFKVRGVSVPYYRFPQNPGG